MELVQAAKARVEATAACNKSLVGRQGRGPVAGRWRRGPLSPHLGGDPRQYFLDLDSDPVAVDDDMPAGNQAAARRWTNT